MPIAAMVLGGLTTLVVFSVNELLDAHYFTSEAFAGLIASIHWDVVFQSSFPRGIGEREAYERCWVSK